MPDCDGEKARALKTCQNTLNSIGGGCDGFQDRACGAKCSKPRRVLTRDDAICIYKRSLPDYSPVRPTATAIARAYRVSEKAIRDIWTGRTWSEATDHLAPHRAPRVARPMGRPVGRLDTKQRKRKEAAFSFRERSASAPQPLPFNSNKVPASGGEPSAVGPVGADGCDFDREPDRKRAVVQRNDYGVEKERVNDTGATPPDGGRIAGPRCLSDSADPNAIEFGGAGAVPHSHGGIRRPVSPPRPAALHPPRLPPPLEEHPPAAAIALPRLAALDVVRGPPPLAQRLPLQMSILSAWITRQKLHQ